MANLGNEICDEVAQMCQDRHIKDIMGFQHDWNKEMIAQFYATVYFGHVLTPDFDKSDVI